MSQKCKDCNGRGWPETGGTLRGIPQISKCETCEGKGGILRTGPYRLADGTWSDGVDRHKRISYQTGYECDQSRMFVWWFAYGGKWVAERAEPFFDEEFPTHAEAIAYADRMARGERG